MGKEPVVDRFPTIPHSIQIPHLQRQGPSTYEAILSGHPEQSKVLTRCGLLRIRGVYENTSSCTQTLDS